MSRAGWYQKSEDGTCSINFKHHGITKYVRIMIIT